MTAFGKLVVAAIIVVIGGIIGLYIYLSNKNSVSIVETPSTQKTASTGVTVSTSTPESTGTNTLQLVATTTSLSTTTKGL